MPQDELRDAISHIVGEGNFPSAEPVPSRGEGPFGELRTPLRTGVAQDAPCSD